MKKLIAVLAVTVLFAGVSFGQATTKTDKKDKKAKTEKKSGKKADKKSDTKPAATK